LRSKILIIDDTKNIKLMIQKALVAEGYEVDCAENGLKGIDLFKSKKYDLVLLDIRMPNLSGTEVLKKLKEIHSDIPVIIITAYPTVRNAVDCIKSGAVDYLRKPFTADKIKAAIKENLDKEQ
jgi:DNA-binding NtrC family response regulator